MSIKKRHTFLHLYKIVHARTRCPR